jgi:hypothetical protein
MAIGGYFKLLWILMAIDGYYINGYCDYYINGYCDYYING